MNWRRKSKSDWGRLDLNFKNLSEVSDYVNERVKVENLTVENYISTENMLPNKGGIDKAIKLPAAKTTSLYSKGDILLSNIRTYFKKIWYAEKDGGCSNDVLVVRARGEIEPKFLYYVLSNDKFFEYSSATSKGTKMPRGDKSAIMQYQIPDMPLEEQRTIVSVLSALDDRIAENKKINHHLEQIGKALFNELYYSGVHAQLGDTIATLESGSRPKGGAVSDGVPSIGAENIERFGIYEYSKEKYISVDFFNKLNRGIVQSGDVLLYKDGAYTGKSSLALDDFPHAQCAINEHVFILRPNNDVPSSFFLYYLLQNDENKQALSSRASSKAAQPGLNQTEVKTLPILLPSKEDIIKFNSDVSGLMHQIANNANENRKLARLRDTLLPKLLSGEISVTN